MKIKIIKFILDKLGYELGKQFPSSPFWILREKNKTK
jgi:hypothetical protein